MNSIVSFLLITTLSLIEPRLNPPICNVAYDGIDLKTKLYTKEMAPQFLFSYTPRELKNELQQENLLKAHAQMMKIEDQMYLNLNLEIYSKTAATQYGAIEKGTKLVVKTIDGKSFDLICRAGSSGQRVAFDKTYLYSVSYDIDKSTVRGLQKAEIDQIGIQWGSGFENYDIYEIDFFINQIACLNQ